MRFNDEILIATANDVPNLRGRFRIWNHLKPNKTPANSQISQQLKDTGKIVHPSFCGLFVSSDGNHKTTRMERCKELEEKFIDLQDKDQSNSIPKRILPTRLNE